jgi:putative ABC transport system substrate-binding protein
MKRREFLGVLGGAAVASRQPAHAQQIARTLRVGALSAQPRSAPIWLAFRQRMAEQGYAEGANFIFEFVQIGGIEGYERGYKDLVARNIDVMLATGPEISLKSAQAATQTLPTVMLAIEYDPVARGYVTSLARPTGNITGIFMRQIELAQKRVEILKEAFPDLRAAIAFWDATSVDQWHAAQTAAAGLGFHLAGVQTDSLLYDFERALAQSAPDHRGNLFVMVSPFFFRERARLADFTLRNRIVSMFGLREWVEAGGLVSYGPNIVDLHRRVADYVGRIANGAKPTDLPIEQPTRFELVLNLKTAKGPGLAVPTSLLLRADDVIE